MSHGIKHINKELLPVFLYRRSLPLHRINCKCVYREIIGPIREASVNWGNRCGTKSHGECAPTVFTEGCYIYLILNIKSGQSILCLGSSWAFGALLKGITSVVVLRVERALDIHSPTYNPCRTRDSNPQPSGYKSNSLTIRPRPPP